jgi:hypothetical protein
MSEDEVVGGVADTVGITIWAVAEDWPRKRGKKARGGGRESEAESKSEAKSKAADRSVRSTQAEAESESRSKTESTSKAAGRSARSTQTSSTRGLTPKQLGEIAEAEFIAKAVGLGFVVAKPWGDSEPYDFIVNVRRTFNFWRVQVKSAHTAGKDGICSFRAYDQHQQPYSAEEIDALVAYARPSEAWYVFPVRVVEGLKSLKLYPGSRQRRSKYEKWREAWEILRRVVRRGRRGEHGSQDPHPSRKGRG